MRIGIFGGSFNPVHNGHLRLAVEAREILALDRVELIPAAVPPHKNCSGLLPFGLRFRLLRMAVAGQSGMYVNPVEARRKGPSFTWETLGDLGRIFPQARLFFLLGVPDLLTLPEWRHGLDLPRRADLVAVARQGMALEETRRFIRGHWPEVRGPERIQAPWGAFWQWQGEHFGRILMIEPPCLEISSTMIRTYWQLGRDLQFLVPEAMHDELTRKRKLLMRYWGRAEQLTFPVVGKCPTWIDFSLSGLRPWRNR